MPPFGIRTKKRKKTLSHALSGRPEDEERPEGDIDATGVYVEQAKEVK